VPENAFTYYLLHYEKIFGKILIDTFKKFPSQWTPLLVPYLQFSLNNLKNFDENRRQEKFLVNMMLFVKLVIVCKQFDAHPSFLC
jgi:hypothetical protein